MFLHYLKIAGRNLWKHKTDSTINIVGLCIAFTSALLLLLRLAYESSYDRFNPQAEHIYKLYWQRQSPGGTVLNTSMPAPLMPALKASYPDIRYAPRLVSGGAPFRYKDKTVSQG